MSRAIAPLTQGCGAIFMMHHVCPPRTEAFQPNRHLEITPEFLRQTVQQIRSSGYEILPIGEAVDLLKAGYARKRYAVLTLDDGYRDNIEHALPILQDLDAPFTVYVASGLIDETAELWWIALEEIIRENAEIRLTDDGNPLPARTVQEKKQCYAQVCRLLTLKVSEMEQRQIVRDLAKRYRYDLPGLSSRFMMSWDDVRALGRQRLATIGAHTQNHYALARLETKDAREDIVTGSDRLEQQTGVKPRHFAYPYGKAYAVSERDAALAGEAGFLSAVTTRPGVLQSAHARQPLMLPRVSLNGCFQERAVVAQYLTGVPFAAYRAVSWLRNGLGLRPA
ncbi:polysaccharide deacetylase family protein [Roseibium hamelinense]|uniref:polysaccharide deacetylase family protein n=1 Tax=Roseibium hamelinense TaxID=150831 RepID=UPI001AD8A9AE|nr:polysaccharide deacetylase family protein [Roseibium hamelinense]